MKKIKISPSILSADFSQLGNEIKRLEMLEDGPSILILKKNPTIIKHLIARVYLNENAFKNNGVNFNIFQKEIKTELLFFLL